MEKYNFEFRLKKGQTVHIEGIPHEYLGFGRIGSNTDVNAILVESKTKEDKTSEVQQGNPQIHI